MSDTTKIQWADATFNPWIGCTKVSPGCAHCYAENTTRARVLRSQGQETWGKGAKRSRTSAATWKNPVKWNREAGRMDGASEQTPMVRFKVFPSLCDWLDEEVPVEWLADFLKLIYETPNLDWLLLTKRPENFLGALMLAGGKNLTEPGDYHPLYFWIRDWMDGKPPRNVWVGVSVEDQKRADERIPMLLNIPAAVRFLSVEPMLGPIDLDLADRNHKGELPWLIVGGESGPGARVCNVAWVRSIVEQCKQAGTKCFVKQLGAVAVNKDSATNHKLQFVMNNTQFNRDIKLKFKDKKGGDINEWPADLRVREFPEVVR